MFRSRPRCALALRDTEVLSCPELALRDPATLLAPQATSHTHGLVHLIFASHRTLAHPHSLQLLAPRAHGPSDPRSDASCCVHTPIHVHMCTQN